MSELRNQVQGQYKQELVEKAVKIQKLEDLNSTTIHQNGKLEKENTDLKKDKEYLRIELDLARSVSSQPLTEVTKLITEIETKIDQNAEVVNRFVNICFRYILNPPLVTT